MHLFPLLLRLISPQTLFREDSTLTFRGVRPETVSSAISILNGHHPIFPMTLMLAQLIPVKDGAPITLTKPITVVGRSSRLCDLAVDHGSVSKLHCILVKTDGLIYMRDLGSTNGTRVNGQRVLRGALLPGDTISFSGAAYAVHLGPDPQLSAGGKITTAATQMISIVTDSDPELSVNNDDVKLLSDSDLLPAD